MSESGVKDAVARRVVRPHELQQWHRNWNGTPNRKMLGQHDIETAIEYLPRPRQWPSPLSASPAKMRAFYSGDDTVALSSPTSPSAAESSCRNLAPEARSKITARSS